MVQEYTMQIAERRKEQIILPIYNIYEAQQWSAQQNI